MTEDKAIEARSRTFDFTMTRAEDDGRGLIMEGYAAVFNSWTEIMGADVSDRGRVRRFLESIAPGAFKKTLQERTPLLQFDHGSHPLVGSIPIGVISSSREDEKGLFVRGRLSDNWLVQPVRDAIADGAISGMSFRFSVPKGRDEWDWTDHDENDGLPKRTVREVDLYELGPVVWPAYAATAVGMRSADLEPLLHDENVRADLARLLTFATEDSASEDAVQEDTSDDANDTPPDGHLSQQMRERLIQDEINAAFLTGKPVKGVEDEQAEVA